MYHFAQDLFSWLRKLAFLQVYRVIQPIKLTFIFLITIVRDTQEYWNLPVSFPDS